MAQGYYTIEQWSKGAGWVAVCALPFGASQSDAETAIEKRGKGGFYRLVQMQRVIWAQREGGKMRLRKSHASSPEKLAETCAMFDRCKGRYPVEEIRVARREMKRRRGRST